MDSLPNVTIQYVAFPGYQDSILMDWMDWIGWIGDGARNVGTQ